MQAALGISVLAVPRRNLLSRSAMRMPEPAWSLHPQLARDTAPVGDLALTRVLAMNDANYPWVILVPRRGGVVEIVDLDEADRTRLMAEIAQVSAALKQLTACDKLNVAAIGNIVPQLHIHVVARRTNDAAWPKPVWGAVPARPYAAGELDVFVAALRRGLAIV
jgi:diadenosine tetraphosphate (Ap4A) HIT family hydrolase